MGNLEKYQSRNPIQRGLIAQFLRHVERLVSPLQPRYVLDAGCGEGFVAAVLQRALAPGGRVVGLDLRRSVLGAARRRGGVVPVGGSVDALPFATACFDLVVATELLEHLTTPETALAELVRVGRAWLLVSVPCEPAFRGLNLLRGKNLRALGSDPDHRQHFSRGAFLRMLSGHAAVVAAPWGAFPWTLALARLPG